MATIQAQNANHEGYTEPLKQEKYTPIRAAILETLPTDEAGLAFSELEARVGEWLRANDVSMALFPKPGSVRWYVKTVQLDLEARALIERVPGVRPMRLRKRP